MITIYVTVLILTIVCCWILAQTSRWDKINLVIITVLLVSSFMFYTVNDKVLGYPVRHQFPERVVLEGFKISPPLLYIWASSLKNPIPKNYETDFTIDKQKLLVSAEKAQKKTGVKQVVNGNILNGKNAVDNNKKGKSKKGSNRSDERSQFGHGPITDFIKLPKKQ